MPIGVLAAAGDLDATFGPDGKVSPAPFTSVVAGGYSVALQPDGKVVAAGYADYDFALARWTAGGILDTGFGMSGVVTGNVRSGSNYAFRALVQPDGKIVVAGTGFSADSPDYAAGFIARYFTSGVPDAAFGTGGKVTYGFGGNLDRVFAAALQPDGKILIAGTYGFGQFADLAVARFNPDGSADPTFGPSPGRLLPGAVTLNFYGHGEHLQANAVLVQPDGKIVAAGTWVYGASSDFAVVRLNSDGSVDSSFSNDGRQAVVFGAPPYGGQEAAWAVARQQDGKILLAGCTDALGNEDIALARLNPDGTLDTSFGTAGRVVTRVSVSEYDCAQGMALQPDGKIVVTGQSTNAGGLTADVAVVRYNPDGSLDPGFGNAGIVTTALPAPNGGNNVASGYDAAIQPDGKILVAAVDYRRMWVLRYEGTTASPPPACSFGLTPTGASVGASGGVFTVTVSASSSCSDFTALSNASWVHVVGDGSAHTGSTNIAYSVDPNTATMERVGTITIAGSTFTVAQAGEPGGSSVATAVEYFHAQFGHYFVTAAPAEIDALDAGGFSGWARTGESFPVHALGAMGASPVCRFWSAQTFAPRVSHFYTPVPGECEVVKGNPDWAYEGEVFAMVLPDSAGGCRSGTVALYRLYNNGMTGAPNHRYTTRLAIRTTMLLQGWTPEGSGALGVIGCVPSP